MSSFNKHCLHIDTEALHETDSFDSFKVALPSTKRSNHPVDQSTISSPKTAFSRQFHKNVTECSVTSRSMRSNRSKYSQSSVLHQSSMFNNLHCPMHKIKDQRKLQQSQEEETHLQLTIDNCRKKATYLKVALETSNINTQQQARRMRKRLTALYPL